MVTSTAYTATLTGAGKLLCTVTVSRTCSITGCSHSAALPSAKDHSVRPSVHKILPVEKKQRCFWQAFTQARQEQHSAREGEAAAALILFFIPAYSKNEEYTEENLKHFYTETFMLKQKRKNITSGET